MKYYIYANATDSDGVDLYTFFGTKEEMMERVRALALDFMSNDDDYESFSCGWDTWGYPIYTATLQYHDYHFEVGGMEAQYLKKLKVTRKSLYKAKKIKENDYFNKPDDDEE